MDNSRPKLLSHFTTLYSGVQAGLPKVRPGSGLWPEGQARAPARGLKGRPERYNVKIIYQSYEHETSTRDARDVYSFVNRHADKELDHNTAQANESHDLRR